YSRPRSRSLCDPSHGSSLILPARCPSRPLDSAGLRDYPRIVPALRIPFSFSPATNLLLMAQTTTDAAATTAPRTLTWEGDADGRLRMIDQTLLPGEFREIVCDSVEKVWEAIRVLRVRGAPAIGCAAAYGVVLGLQSVADTDRATFDKRLQEV